LPAPVRFYGFPDEVRSYFQKADWLADVALALERQLARLTNWSNPARCDLVTLTHRGDREDDFVEFPQTSGVERFDPADRKFVAVSCAHAERPPILQAVDSKWWGWRGALARAGVTVEFLCPAEVAATYEAKVERRRRPRARRRRV
jgi:hypothetical protein